MLGQFLGLDRLGWVTKFILIASWIGFGLENFKLIKSGPTHSYI